MLTLVSVPIGNPGDLTLRAMEVLKQAELVIGEEKKETDLLLRRLGLEGKPYELLNEHSSDRDLEALVNICAQKSVALVTDCGTPGFCDPGADLVRLCRKRKISVTAAPGASSLMTFLSLCGRRLDQFHFEGFLPRESEVREARLLKLLKFRIPVLVMDTPYRMKKCLEEVARLAPSKRIVLGCDLTSEAEQFLSGTAKDVLMTLSKDKAEFLMLLEPSDEAKK